MNKPTIELIHRVMEKSGMTVFKHPFSVTLGGIRTKDNSSNKFNDWLFASYYDEQGKLHSIIEAGTTDAGLYYRENPMNIDGTAIIQHGVQHLGVYQYQDPAKNPDQKGHKGKEAFRQIKDMKYWRDADRDSYLEFDGEEEVGNNSTNGHDMGTSGNNVDKWSAGCWGAPEATMDKFYAVAKIQIAHGLKDIFSYAMLHENAFADA
jgi:hypothetical protein